MLRLPICIIMFEPVTQFRTFSILSLLPFCQSLTVVVAAFAMFLQCLLCVAEQICRVNGTSNGQALTAASTALKVANKNSEIVSTALEVAEESREVAEESREVATAAMYVAESKPDEETVVSIVRREIEASASSSSSTTTDSSHLHSTVLPWTLPPTVVSAYVNDHDKKSGLAFRSNWKDSIELYTKNVFVATNYLLRLKGVYVVNGQVYFDKDILPELQEKVKSKTNYDLGFIVDIISAILHGMHRGKLKQHAMLGNTPTLYRAIKDLPAEMQLREGGIYRDGGFLSTSKEKGAIHIGGTGKGWKYLFVIRSSSGYNIEKFSSKPLEQEVLFQPGQMFRITKIEKDAVDEMYGPITIVHMTEL